MNNTNAVEVMIQLVFALLITASSAIESSGILKSMNKEIASFLTRLNDIDSPFIDKC
jgi:hypothetical protein